MENLAHRAFLRSAEHDATSNPETNISMLGFTAQGLMELEAGSLAGVPYGKLSDDMVDPATVFATASWIAADKLCASFRLA